jgi:hypothetical protein
MNGHSMLRVTTLWVLLSCVAMGQEGAPAANPTGGYDLIGTLRLGYRFTSVSSGTNDGEWFQSNAENLFREQYNLTDSGFALGRQLPLALDLFATKPVGADGLFDQLFLNVDLNPTVAGGSLRMRQFGAFDLNLSYRNVEYFFDRYDSLFEDLRRYETNRNDLAASLDVTLTDVFGVGLSYHGTGHGGTLTMPRPMFIEGATGLASWQAVSRLYYRTESPRTDFNSDFVASLNAGFDLLDVVVGGGFTSYSEDYSVTGLPGPDSLALGFRDTNNAQGGFANRFGIVGDQTARERLHDYEHTETRELSGPVVLGQLVVRPLDIVRLTADVRVENLEGTTTVHTAQLAEARKSNAARAFQLYRGTYDGDVATELTRMRASVAATVIPMPDLSISAGWRMRRDDHRSDARYRVTFDSTTSLTETVAFRSVLPGDSVTAMEWEQESLQPEQTYFGTVTYSPIRELTLSAGVRASTRSPEVMRSEHGEIDSVVTNNMSKETSGLGFDVGASYTPIAGLRLRGRFEMMQREATFSDDAFAGGPTAGTVSDLEPRTAPEDRMRINASVDWRILEELDAGVRFGMQNARSELDESMWVLDGASEQLELVDDHTTVAGTINYRLDENTTIRLLGETRTSTFSIPVTWTRGQELITPLFPVDPSAPPSTGTNEYDSATVVFRQETDDLYLDFGVTTRLIERLGIGAGVSYLAVKGEPTTTPEVKNTAGTPTRQGDITRVGGPFTRLIVNGSVGFDITEQFGLGVDVMYAMQDEEEVIDEGVNVPRRFYGYNDYDGLSAVFSLVYNF